jgi:hypothetical protein
VPPGTAEELHALWDAQPGQEPPEEVALRRAFALKALDRGLASDFDVVFAWRRALARALLQEKFEVEHSPDLIPEEVWRTIYYDSAVRPGFDHFDTYFVTDVHIICCRESVARCNADPKARSCLEVEENTIRQAFEVVRGRSFKDAPAVNAFVQTDLAPRFPSIGSYDFTFQYNFNAPPDRQKGYKVVNENVAHAARTAPDHQLAPPVRSNHGWHMIYVSKHLPEVHRPFGDPSVMSELRQRFYPAVRQRDVLAFIGTLLKQHDVRIDEEALRTIDWSRVTGLTP